jgi:hypothetical protein
MEPKFATELAWQQAELLMQPIYIRVVDNIRKISEGSQWEVSYEEVKTPHPTSYLCLQSEDKQLKYEIWDLCYQVCFLNYYGSHPEVESQIVEIDTTPIDPETGALDWHYLDDKAKQVIDRVFDNLP